MNLFKKYTSAVLIMCMLFLPISPMSSSYAKNSAQGSIIILDSNSKKSLPDRFREIKSLNISGSAQFTPLELPNIISKTNSSKLFIVDLRQESHGFINDTSISFYNPELDLNNGFTTSQTITNENNALSSIPLDKNITVHSKTTRPLFNVLVKSTSNEANVVRLKGLSYVRLSVKDGSIPSPEIVDKFVAMVKHQVENSHLHFHCDTGKGRTATFLSMYQMMKNKKNLSLEEILNYQSSIGGIALTDNEDRSEFLHEFYRYAQENMKNNFRVTYSKWIKCPISKYNEISQ